MRGSHISVSLMTVLAAGITSGLADQQPFQLGSTPKQADGLVFTSASSPNPADFTGQQVLSFSTTSESQLQTLLQKAYALDLDVWSASRGRTCASSSSSKPFDSDLACVDIRLANPVADSTAQVASQSSSRLHQQLMQPFSLADRPQSHVKIQDVQQLIDSQHALHASSKNLSWHQTYHNYEEINQFMHDLADAYPAYAKLIEVGKTHEGRSILGIKIGSGQKPDPPSQPEPQPNPNPEPKPSPPSTQRRKKALKFRKSRNTSAKNVDDEKIGIVISGEQHAREWISASTTLFFASELLHSALGRPGNKSIASKLSSFNENADDSAFATSRRKSRKRKGKKGSKKALPWSKKEAALILDTFDITFIPLTNPDGYVYSWQKNRMWRKNRQPNQFPGGLFCKGVDLNRNWGYAFNLASASTDGYALNACSEMYPGASAFSSIETRALAEYLQDPVNNIRGFFDLHSYGQLLMYPYSWNCQETVADEEDLLEMSLGAVRALKSVHGRTFNTGKICQVYAQSGGSAVDWAYASTTRVGNNTATRTKGENHDGDDDEDDDDPEQPSPVPIPAKRKIKWSYSIELRDGGTYGFLLPQEQIIPSSQEVSKAFVYMLQFIAKREKR